MIINLILNTLSDLRIINESARVRYKYQEFKKCVNQGWFSEKAERHISQMNMSYTEHETHSAHYYQVQIYRAEIRLQFHLSTHD